jgi:hypothetical protein
MLRTWLRTETLLLVALFVAGTAYAASIWLRRQAITSETGITVRQESLDFGDVWAQEAFSWTVPLYNHTSVDIEVTDFVTSCACTSVRPRSLVIPANGEAQVEAVIDLRPMAPTTEFDRPFAVEMAAVTRQHHRVGLSWGLKGRVRDAVIVSASKLEFDQELVRGRPFTPTGIDLICRPGCVLRDARCNPEFGSVALIDRDSPGHVRLEVTPAPALPAGTNEFDVTLTMQGPQGEALPNVHVPVVCTVAYDVEVLPPKMSFGACPLGMEFATTVSLRSCTGKPFVVDEVVAPGDDIRILEASEQGTSNSNLIHVSGVVASTGSQSRQIRFVVSQGHEPEPYELTFDVLYHGLGHQPAE